MDNIQINKMPKGQTEALEFLSKWGLFIGYVAIGLIGKLGFDIVNSKRMTFWYVFGTGCVAYCVGFLSWQWCTVNHWNPGIVVPAASLISRDIMLFLTMIDWQGVLKLLTGKSTKDK